jgi:phosphoribosylanthranilate isomerase
MSRVARDSMQPKVKVKICGITSWADARCACEAGADFLGFNFYPASPRYIEPAKARRIVGRVPKNVGAVGVFVDESEEVMLETARVVGLKYLQLHGDESPALISGLRRTARSVKVIKAIRVRRSLGGRQVRQFRNASAILLDGFDAQRRGGTGKTFNWSLARRFRVRHRIFLAGGLTPENVAAAIRKAQPFAIDVCSGVESAPGKKDPAKIKALMQAISGCRPVRKKAGNKK